MGSKSYGAIMVLLVIALVLIGFIQYANAQERQSGVVSFGLAKDSAWNSSEHIARMRSHGLTDHAVVYYALLSEANRADPFAWIRANYLAAGIDTTVTLIINDGEPDLLQRVSDGWFDEELQRLAVRVRDSDTPVMLRPFHEIDGSWYPWGMYAPGNSCELAAQAVLHVIDVFDQVGADNVTWEININRRDGRGQVFSDAECFVPLVEDRIDAWSVSTYNRCGSSDTYPDERSFASEFRPIYDRLASLSDLSINVAEVSTTGLCAPRLPWFEEMLRDLERFPQTERVTFYFGVVPVGAASNAVEINWGFDQEPEWIAPFRELIARTGEQAAVDIPPQRPVQPTQVSSQPVVVLPPPARSRLALPIGVPIVDPSESDKLFGFDSMPWSIWTRFDVPFAEVGNPAINPVTGNPFGETGPVLRFNVEQLFLWDAGTFEHGPGLALSGAFSRNNDQWWNNQTTAYVTYGFYQDFPRDGPVDWGGWSFEAFAGYQWYYAPTPGRINDGSPVFGIRGTVNFGGDWAQ